ncbi:MAG: hypothetical protein KIT18_16740 [Burkholderiales bacterium]|nr:hypothetical protein [Burkholderiales bacterium]
MSRKVLLVVPEAPAVQAASASTERALSGKGLRVGILDNSKSNADHLLKCLLEGVQAQFPVASVVSLRKPTASAGAAPQIIDRLAQDADCVLTAMAD